MARLLSKRLSVRQTVYVLSAVVVLTTAVAAIEFVLAYRAERQRVGGLTDEIVASVENVAARAAFHVDDIQATATLDGVMRFEKIEFARITTDFGVVLAERRRRSPVHFTDGLTRHLFGDVTSRRKQLQISRKNIGSANEARFGTGGAYVQVGVMEIRLGPEQIGRAFLARLTEVAGVLLIEFLLLGAAIAYVLHRTLTRPLLRYAQDIASIDPETAEAAEIGVPPGHADDELGMVVSQTNRLFRRIDQQKAALLHREKVAALGTMLAGVAHELNNPLAILTAQAELLEETAPDERTKERARKILNPAARCARIIRTFLALARHREIEKTNVSVAELVGEIVEIMEYQLHADGIRLDVEMDDGLPSIWGDGSQLSQALINIVVNAQQALSTEEGDRVITLSTTAIPGRDVVEISVADTGPGVPPSVQNRIFEPFFTTKVEGKGTGLGLSYCVTVAESHGGTVRVDDTPAGGTIITLALPISTRGSSEGTVEGAAS